jgi:hypothetical protein
MSEQKKNITSIYAREDVIKDIRTLYYITQSRTQPFLVRKMVLVLKTLINIAKQEGVEPTEFFKAMEWILEAEPSGIRESFQKYLNSLD